MEICVNKSVAILSKSPNESEEEFNNFINSYLYVTYYTKTRDYYTKKFKSVKQISPLFTKKSGHHYNIPVGLIKLLPQDNLNITDQSENILITDITPDNINEVRNEIIHLLPQYDLREDQSAAVLKSLIGKRGIIQMPTGSGKTTIIAAILKYLSNHNKGDLHALVVAPTLTILNNIEYTLNLSGLDVASYKSDKSCSHEITVAHPKALLSKDMDKNELAKFNVVIYDETHHMTSSGYQTISELCTNAEYSIGLSAKVLSDKALMSTNIKEYTYSELISVGATGTALIFIPPKLYIDEAILATPVVFRINNPSNNNIPEKYANDWHKLNEYIIMGYDRNYQTSLAASIFHKYNRKILILVSQKSQAYDIGSLLVELGVTSIGLSFGGNSGFLYQGVDYKGNAVFYPESGSCVLNQFNQGDVNILIATNHMDEGADISYLDVCILASGGKDPKRILQRVGRALRLTKSGKYAYVVDFTDSGSSVLAYHSKLRFDIYKSELGITDDRLKTISISELESQFKLLEEINDPPVIDH